MLGPVELHAGGKPVDIGPPRQRAVLAALSVDVGRPVLPGTMIDRVWGQEPPDGVRHGLHVYVARIRRVLRQADPSTATSLVRRSGGYVLDVDPDQVDMHRFARLVQQSRDPACRDLDRVTLLRQAMRLWRDTPLADLPGLWVEQVRQTLVQQRLDTAVAWAQAEVAVGGAAATIPTLTELVGEHPLVESLAAALMRAHHATGNTEEALTSYTSMRQRLVEALGIEPGAELKALHQQVLRADLDEPAARPPALSTALSTTRSVAPSIALSLPDSPVPAQLPMDVPGFSGRGAELGQLDALLTQAEGVGVSVVSGTAGVGKTALAVHWAHRVRSSFPDGQLCVDLRGFAPDSSATPDEVIGGFLEALGVARHRVPATLADRAALYRSMLSGRRMLVVLDNARDAQQVRPLLPGSPGCLVLVTSRHQLPGLVAHGARPLVLDLPSPDEAREMMIRRLGVTDRGTLDEIIALCARLPLALSISAARATTRPHVPLRALADELRRTSGSLAAFVGDDEATNVRAALSWSYRALSPEAATLFRRLSQHPGPEFTVASAAALSGSSPARARRLLTELAHAHLVTEQNPGRYAMHDLLRAYAIEQAHKVDVDADRQAALLRMLDSDPETLGFGIRAGRPR
ncbi:AfsR/SARP family transcriptional regulator [Kutzneria chonburiensis]|uniref:BTAD domain-containing putative transcriptional regulator n=1 Tax=Kutzneria chonburiensis TaxID=1483604 RepID=A0ABV6MMR9_9PSEU|nr:BTAD domain-containing putative transcriptional regulator [Kutzneria chonburiensis]